MTRAEEARADGEDHLAHAILRDLNRELERVAHPGTPCPRCGHGFRWPGELEAHVRAVHWRDEGVA
jgi:hypothetical protein